MREVAVVVAAMTIFGISRKSNLEMFAEAGVAGPVFRQLSGRFSGRQTTPYVLALVELEQGPWVMGLQSDKTPE